MSYRGSNTRAMAFFVVMILATQTSCITAAVWGGSVEDRNGDGTSTLHSTGGHAFSDNTLVKIILTPFAIVLDICTYPVQAAMFGWDDEEDDRRRDCR